MYFAPERINIEFFIDSFNCDNLRLTQLVSGSGVDVTAEFHSLYYVAICVLL